MKAKRVRFKDSEAEPNHPASCRFGDTSVPCEAREDPIERPAASSEPKTSEFMFFKKLKQDVGRSFCQSPPNRKGHPLRTVGPSNHSKDLGDLKSKDVKSSRFVKKSTTGEFGTFLSSKDAGLESSATPTSNKELDSGRLKSSSLVKTPCISLDTFLSTTTNGSVSRESQQKDGDIFSSKRLKLLQQIAKTLFPDADEVPKDCNLVFLLLRRLLPESSQEALLQNQRLRQRESTENFQLHLDSNIQLKETLNTRKLLEANDDHSLDSSISAAKSYRFLEPLPSCQTVENNDASAARYCGRMLGHEEGNEQGSSLNGIAYGCRSKRLEGRNQWTWSNQLCDYSTASNTSPNIFKNEAYNQFPYDAYDSSWSCKFRDQSHSYEVLDRSYDTFAAAKTGNLVYKDEIYDFNVDREAQFSPSTWNDSSFRVSLERFRPFGFINCSDYIEPDCLNSFQVRRERCPRLIGWNSDESNVHDSTQTTNMEIQICSPPSSRCGKDLEDQLELQVYCPQSSTPSRDPWISPEKSKFLHLSPYTYQDHDIQGQHSPEKHLVPRSPCFPDKLSYGPDQLDPVDFALSKSRGSSFFYIPQNGSRSMASKTCERNRQAVEAFPCLPRLKSDTDSKCKLVTDFVNEQYNTCAADNILEHFRPENSGSRFLIASEDFPSTSEPERWSTTSLDVPVGQEDLYPSQFHTLMWKDTDADNCDYDREITSTSDSLFW